MLLLYGIQAIIILLYKRCTIWGNFFRSNVIIGRRCGFRKIHWWCIIVVDVFLIFVLPGQELELLSKISFYGGLYWWWFDLKIFFPRLDVKDDVRIEHFTQRGNFLFLL